MTFFLCLLGADPHAAAVHAASWALLLLLLCLEQLLLKCTRMLAFQVVMGEKGLSQLLLLLIARIKFLLPDNNLLPFLSLQVVMGEKGLSQLQRDMRESIYATIAGGCRFRQLEKDGTGSVCVCGMWESIYATISGAHWCSCKPAPVADVAAAAVTAAME